MLEQTFYNHIWCIKRMMPSKSYKKNMAIEKWFGITRFCITVFPQK